MDTPFAAVGPVRFPLIGFAGEVQADAEVTTYAQAPVKGPGSVPGTTRLAPAASGYGLVM